MRVPATRQMYTGPDAFGGTVFARVKRLERDLARSEYRARALSANVAAGMKQAAAAGAAAAVRR